MPDPHIQMSGSTIIEASSTQHQFNSQTGKHQATLMLEEDLSPHNRGKEKESDELSGLFNNHIRFSHLAINKSQCISQTSQRKI